MKMQNYLKNINFHHAYLIKGAKETIVPELFLFFEKEWNFIVKANPDFWHGDFDTFGIDEGRVVREMQTRRSFGGGKKIFVITASFFTREAQNSLLKVLEEPTPDTHFFLITQNTQSLLPTLKSRLHIISLRRAFPRRREGKPFAGSADPKQGLGKLTEEFLSANTPKRIELLKGVVENKDKNDAIRFLDDLEVSLHDLRAETFVFEEIRKCRSYLNDRSPSVKMILEHVAVIVPCIDK